MYCVNCGKKINDDVMFCPECGAAQERPEQSGANTEKHVYGLENQPEVKKTSYNTMSIVGLSVSGASLVINLYGLVGVLGIILSIIGLISCKKNNESGQILAIIGIVIGVLSVAFAFIIISLASLSII